MDNNELRIEDETQVSRIFSLPFYDQYDPYVKNGQLPVSYP